VRGPRPQLRHGGIEQASVLENTTEDAVRRLAERMLATLHAQYVIGEQEVTVAGCHLGQGYLFARPVPAAEFHHDLAAR